MATTEKKSDRLPSLTLPCFLHGRGGEGFALDCDAPTANVTHTVSSNALTDDSHHRTMDRRLDRTWRHGRLGVYLPAWTELR